MTVTIIPQFPCGVVINNGEGVATKREWGGGGTVKFYPYKNGRGGDGNIFGHPEVGHNKFWGSFSMGALSFSHTAGGSAQKVSSL